MSRSRPTGAHRLLRGKHVQLDKPTDTSVMLYKKHLQLGKKDFHHPAYGFFIYFKNTVKTQALADTRTSTSKKTHTHTAMVNLLLC